MPYRIALVEYLNTFPFSAGIRLNGLEEKLEVHRVIPSLCAQLFQEGKVDLSLCPVGALTDMPDHRICGKYCIGADGEVGTVVVLSQVPLERIEKVKLDDHSRTSNILLQILAQHHWKRDWNYYFNKDYTLQDTCLMIGDKVFAHREHYAYAFDLAEVWKQMTGLPMVFALWISKPGIPQEVINDIDTAFEKGMRSVMNDESGLEKWQKEYLLNYISYPLDESKMKALRLFQDLASGL